MTTPIDHAKVRAALSTECTDSLAELFAKLEDRTEVLPPLPQTFRASEVNAMGGARIASPEDALRFLTAGKACVTLVSKKTGNRFTYRVTASNDGSCYFVGLLNGTDNNSDYKYLGRIARGIFWPGRKVPRPGDVGRDAPSMRAFSWAFKLLSAGRDSADMEIWHEGLCARCGRRLTVPESVKTGFGPECAGKV